MNTMHLRDKSSDGGFAGRAVPIALLLGLGAPRIASAGPFPPADTASSAGTSVSKSILDAIDGSVGARVEAAPVDVLPVSSEDVASNENHSELRAISPLGLRLLAIRSRIVESGLPLLDWDEVAAEKAEMRRDR
jgi:hypothetical protein